MLGAVGVVERGLGTTLLYAFRGTAAAGRLSDAEPLGVVLPLHPARVRIVNLEPA